MHSTFEWTNGNLYHYLFFWVRRIMSSKPFFCMDILLHTKIKKKKVHYFGEHDTINRFFTFRTSSDPLKSWQCQGVEEFTRYVSNLKIKNIFSFSSILTINYLERSYLLSALPVLIWTSKMVKYIHSGTITWSKQVSNSIGHEYLFKYEVFRKNKGYKW